MINVTEAATNLVTRPTYGWIPMGDGMEYTPTPCRLDRGVFGSEPVYVVRDRASRRQYALVRTYGRVVKGDLGSFVSAEAEPMCDASAVRKVAQFGSRAAVVRALSAF